MADGTSIESLNNGQIDNIADEQKMQAILSDMNASGADIPTQASPPSQQPIPPMQPMQPMPVMKQQLPPPPMMHMQPMQPMQPMQQPQYQPQYVAADEEEESYKKPKKRTNVWSSVLSNLRDPFLVACIVFLISLPVLHTWLAKYISWGFSIGGQLSWIGLFALSIFGGILFGLSQFGLNMLF